MVMQHRVVQCVVVFCRTDIVSVVYAFMHAYVHACQACQCVRVHACICLQSCMHACMHRCIHACKLLVFMPRLQRMLNLSFFLVSFGRPWLFVYSLTCKAIGSMPSPKAPERGLGPVPGGRPGFDPHRRHARGALRPVLQPGQRDAGARDFCVKNEVPSILRADCEQ